ncbi:MAG TPA: tryptophan--tRNA ligase [Nitrospirota bacterium]
MVRLLSGMRPTGRLHLGHLVGALENWISLQDTYDCFFAIADWHALTTASADTSQLSGNTMEMAQSWRAIGIDFSRSTVFVQSHLPEHAELHLLLSMVTPMSWLERDPTLKAMVEDMHIKSVSYGLMGYPVLQAADILLYKAKAVPVGVDQLPHIELAREVARSFNRTFKETFPEPAALLTPTPKLNGIDGRKMSKSLGNCVYLDDAPVEIEAKIIKLFTDPAKVHKDDPGNPDICHLQDYHKVFRPFDADEHDRACRAGRLGCVQHKKLVAATISDRLAGYRERKAGLAGREAETAAMLAAGAGRAREVARATMEQARAAAGIFSG